MKRSVAALSSILVLLATTLAQNPQQPPPQQPREDVLRITTELVQTDVVVTDKNDSIVPDLKLEDFEVYDNGKKQELQFVEFINAEAPISSSDSRVSVAPGVDASVARDLAAKDLRRVIAFVIDDVTIPAQDIARTRLMLNDFVDNKMQSGDLVAVVRTVGGKGLLEQFTTDHSILHRAIAELRVKKDFAAVLRFLSGTKKNKKNT